MEDREAGWISRLYALVHQYVSELVSREHQSHTKSRPIQNLVINQRLIKLNYQVRINNNSQILIAIDIIHALLVCSRLIRESYDRQFPCQNWPNCEAANFK
jgi:hypothetical protein